MAADAPFTLAIPAMPASRGRRVLRVLGALSAVVAVAVAGFATYGRHIEEKQRANALSLNGAGYFISGLTSQEQAVNNCIMLGNCARVMALREKFLSTRDTEVAIAAWRELSRESPFYAESIRRDSPEEIAGLDRLAGTGRCAVPCRPAR